MMLRIDFYESGIGETTVITFPDDSIGIVDAYPSLYRKRKDIIDLVTGKKIRFVCLSHPHHDHAEDLVKIMRYSSPESFWNTVPSAKSFFYVISESPYYPSSIRPYYENIKREEIKSLIELFYLAGKKKIVQKKLSDNHEQIDIGGVKISFLAPSEDSISKYDYAINDYASKKRKSLLSPNLISTVIVFQYGNFVFVHGGDTEAYQWIKAYDNFHKKNLSLATLLKVPHHGAWNSIFNTKEGDTFVSKKNYQKLFRPNSELVIFGNKTHPHLCVLKQLSKKTKALNCLISCLASRDFNPLNIPGGKARASSPCNDVISVKVDSDGKYEIIEGKSCKDCEKFSGCLSRPLSF